MCEICDTFLIIFFLYAHTHTYLEEKVAKIWKKGWDLFIDCF